MRIQQIRRCFLFFLWPDRSGKRMVYMRGKTGKNYTRKRYGHFEMEML